MKIKWRGSASAPLVSEWEYHQCFYMDRHCAAELPDDWDYYRSIQIRQYLTIFDKEDLFGPHVDSRLGTAQRSIIVIRAQKSRPVGWLTAKPAFCRHIAEANESWNLGPPESDIWLRHLFIVIYSECLLVFVLLMLRVQLERYWLFHGVSPPNCSHFNYKLITCGKLDVINVLVVHGIRLADTGLSVYSVE
jgi:hypothetical protein